MQYAHGEFIITRCGDAVLTQAMGRGTESV